MQQQYPAVPLTEKELLDEKFAGWHQRPRHSKFKNLAANVYEGRELERTTSQDCIRMKEAEDVLVSLRSYMNTTANDVKNISFNSITTCKAIGSSAVSIADCMRLKQSVREKRAAAIAEATSTANVIAEAEAAPLPLAQPQWSQPSSSLAAAPARPRSAPSLRRNLEMEGGSLLDSVRRHNANRFKSKADEATPSSAAGPINMFAAFNCAPEPAPPSSSSGSKSEQESSTLLRLASRTQEERFNRFAHTRGQQDIIDAAVVEKSGQSHGHMHEPPGIQKPSKAVNMAEFGKKQEKWLESVQCKRDAVKRELESNEAKDYRVVPDIKLTAESWERAKREHSLQAEKQAKLDEDRRELLLLKEEMRNQRLESSLAKSQPKKAAGDEMKKKVKRRPKATKLLKSRDQDGEDYLHSVRYDPDNFCLPFDADFRGQQDPDLERAPRFLTPRGILPSQPAHPKIDSLDLLGIGAGAHTQEVYSSSRRSQTARTQAATHLQNSSISENFVKANKKKQQQMQPQPMGAMAKLGSSLILEETLIGNESDRIWLENILRQRKDAQRAREEDFEREVAVAMGTESERTTKKKRKGSSSIDMTAAAGRSNGEDQNASLHLPAPSINAAAINVSAAIAGATIAAPAVAAATAEANDLEDDLYISDDDSDDPRRLARTAVVDTRTSSDKLDALITDLDDLRGRLEKNIWMPPVPASAPVLVDEGASKKLASMASTSSIYQSVPIKTAMLSVAPSISAPQIAANLEFNGSAITAAPKPLPQSVRDPVHEPLQLDIPPSGFLLANMDRSPRKNFGAATARPHTSLAARGLADPRKPSATASAALSAAMLDYNAVARDFQVKNDPLTDSLLSRIPMPVQDDAPARPQRPYTSHLQTAAQREFTSNHRREELTRFFDSSSTADKGRFRLHDARDFIVDSMFRKADILNDAVTLLCGTRKDTGQQQIITVLFDRAEFSEPKARDWWVQHRDRIIF